ncbi:MAG: glycosyltransferase family 4 protein [Desulfobulbaceae bacterium]|nr:glycosyltransferase family 4 protein [Desulfobulbaceae bacterium]
MKVLLANTFDTEGGAARAAYRLHKGLQQIGTESNLLVQQKSSTDQSVHGPPSKIERAFPKIWTSIDRIPLFLYPRRQKVSFSPAIAPGRLLAEIQRRPAEIVHLHWITDGFLKIEALSKIKQPIIWTLHDMWAFTGGCHTDQQCGLYRQSCGNCPLLKSHKNKDLSSHTLNRKIKYWKNLNLTIVTPSKWLSKCAINSSLFSNYRIETIPNGLDLSVYKPINKKICRQILNLPTDKKIILFGSMGITFDKNKGFQLLQPALNKFALNGWKNNAIAICFGSSEPLNPPDMGIPILYYDRLHDDIALSIILSAADIVIVPSLQENLPNTIMEAMACATPVAAFNIGGIPDLITHKKNGFLVTPFDIDQLAYGIDWILKDTERWNSLSRASRKKIEQNYEISTIAHRYMKLYESVL